MIEVPPLQFAPTNGIRMGYYEAGPNTDTPPVVLCHGWPEIAFSWRHQIKALGDAGIRVIAPDQRGYGATDRPEPIEAYDIEHLTGDLVGLLDHLGIDKAIFVGHDWGGFIVWQMPLRHIDRVAGVVGINTPHTSRAPADPIELLRQRFGEQMYIVQFQDPARGADKILDRKSTRLNSSHLGISYAVFCLKKKKKRSHDEIDDSEAHGWQACMRWRSVDSFFPVSL